MSDAETVYRLEFKAKVALEAIQGHLTVAELASKIRGPPDTDCSLEARGDREAGPGLR